MPGPGPVGEAGGLSAMARRRVRDRGDLGVGLRRCGRQHTQAAAVLGDTPLGSLAQVVPQMPPVGDLHSLRRSGSGTFGEERRAVPADDLNTRSLGEPGGQTGCLPVRKQIDRPTGFDVHQHGAVVVTLAGGVLIDADHPRRGHLRLGQGIDQAQYRAPADGHAEDGGQPGAGSSGQGKTDRGQSGTQPLGALTVPAGEAGYLFHEGPPRARGVAAAEPPNS